MKKALVMMPYSLQTREDWINLKSLISSRWFQQCVNTISVIFPSDYLFNKTMELINEGEPSKKLNEELRKILNEWQVKIHPERFATLISEPISQVEHLILGSRLLANLTETVISKIKKKIQIITGNAMMILLEEKSPRNATFVEVKDLKSVVSKNGDWIVLDFPYNGNTIQTWKKVLSDSSVKVPREWILPVSLQAEFQFPNSDGALLTYEEMLDFTQLLGIEANAFVQASKSTGTPICLKDSAKNIDFKANQFGDLSGVKAVFRATVLTDHQFSEQDASCKGIFIDIAKWNVKFALDFAPSSVGEEVFIEIGKRPSVCGLLDLGTFRLLKEQPILRKMERGKNAKLDQLLREQKEGILHFSTDKGHYSLRVPFVLYYGKLLLIPPIIHYNIFKKVIGKRVLLTIFDENKPSTLEGELKVVPSNMDNDWKELLETDEEEIRTFAAQEGLESRLSYYWKRAILEMVEVKVR